MNPALRLGVELPPLPAGSSPLRPEPHSGARPADSHGEGEGSPLATWRRVGAAATIAGVGTVWLTGTLPEEGHLTTAARWCDPCTLAGALARSIEGPMIGVVSSLPSGRHPSVLARDMTTLDLVSGGRAAAQLCWDSLSPADLVDACEHLVEAVAVCATVLRGGEPSYDGSRYRVSGARNRPLPRQPGGPPVLVAPPASLSAALVAGGTAAGQVGGLARRLVGVADAVVCPPDPAAVSAWRSVLDDHPMEPSPRVSAAGLLCAFRPAGRRTPARVLSSARDAGAQGVVVKLSPEVMVRFARSRPSRAALPDVLAASFVPWTTTRG